MVCAVYTVVSPVMIGLSYRIQQIQFSDRATSGWDRKLALALTPQATGSKPAPVGPAVFLRNRDGLLGAVV